VALGLEEMLVELLLEGVLLLVVPNLEAEEQEHRMQLMLSWPSSSSGGDRL
jgi:competence protein ComGC